jgi:hypothetical protein
MDLLLAKKVVLQNKGKNEGIKSKEMKDRKVPFIF